MDTMITDSASHSSSRRSAHRPLWAGRGHPRGGSAWRRAVTAVSRWLSGVERCVAWFLGDNDAKVPLLDERTGGCSDGLASAGRSRNQGAESTLAMIAVLQQGNRMAAARAEG